MSLAGTKHVLTPTSSTSSLSPPKKMPRSDEPGSELQEEASASTSTQLEPNLLGGQTETKIDSKVSSSGSKDDKFEADLLSNLTCGICSDLYYVPVALLPCLHVYCGACAATWLQEHASCPTCRKTVNKVVDSHPTKQMLALYSSLSKETSLHGERTAEEIAYMDGIYQAGRAIEICSDNQEDEEEEEDEDEPLVFRPPCPCCHADNQFNYVCPEPLAENTYSIYSDLPSSHRVCVSCNGAFPRREEDEDTFCQRCEKWYCPAFLTCPNRGEGPKKLEDQTIYSHTEQIYHNDSLEPYRGMGKYEVKVLADYLRTADGSSSGLLQAYFATQTTLHDNITKGAGYAYIVSEEFELPAYDPVAVNTQTSTLKRQRFAPHKLVKGAILIPLCFWAWTSLGYRSSTLESKLVPVFSPYEIDSFKSSLAKCDQLALTPGAPANFAEGRRKSDRFVEGTKAVLIKNATVWTGEDDGRELLSGTDIYLDGGVIVEIGQGLTSFSEDVIQIDAHGAFLTPGLVDLHSHSGVGAAPGLSGASDTNSRQNPILPYLRSLDGYNTHDLARHRIAGGGVTTSLVLPGSANNIGGQAFLFKNRKTQENTPISMTLEPPFNIPNVTSDRDARVYAEQGHLRWRHMKGACGENIRRVYGQVRLDLAWNFRSAFEKARLIKESQDEYCSKAYAAAESKEVLKEKFPEDLQWEALVDLLRGRVKLNTHCYETTDFDAIIRHSNEFKFPIAAFHHAHEAYLVPDRLKETYGGAPAIAMFATNMRFIVSSSP
ncbi:hypothetical protein BT69DRAFT_1356805 [Atractiella rhizophila]|nr:hypothetical protein BT69DRAFT_1356805 [Atractiella rhizophila]